MSKYISKFVDTEGKFVNFIKPFQLFAPNSYVIGWVQKNGHEVSMPDHRFSEYNIERAFTAGDIEKGVYFFKVFSVNAKKEHAYNILEPIYKFPISDFTYSYSESADIINAIQFITDMTWIQCSTFYICREQADVYTSIFKLLKFFGLKDELNILLNVNTMDEMKAMYDNAVDSIYAKYLEVYDTIDISNAAYIGAIYSDAYSNIGDRIISEHDCIESIAEYKSKSSNFPWRMPILYITVGGERIHRIEERDIFKQCGRSDIFRLSTENGVIYKAVDSLGASDFIVCLDSSSESDEIAHRKAIDFAERDMLDCITTELQFDQYIYSNYPKIYNKLRDMAYSLIPFAMSTFIANLQKYKSDKAERDAKMDRIANGSLDDIRDIFNPLVNVYACSKPDFAVLFAYALLAGESDDRIKYLKNADGSLKNIDQLMNIIYNSDVNDKNLDIFELSKKYADKKAAEKEALKSARKARKAADKAAKAK